MFGDRPIGSVDGAVDERVGRRVRVRNRYAPELRAAGDVRPSLRPPLGRIGIVVVLVGVPVRPAVDRQRRNVPLGVEPARLQIAMPM